MIATSMVAASVAEPRPLLKIEHTFGAAAGFLNEWGFPIDVRSKDLLLQMFNDYRMMEQIRAINEMDRFSLETWMNATLAERTVILLEYKAALMEVMDFTINPGFGLFYEEVGADGLVEAGQFNHTTQMVRLNRHIIEHEWTDLSHDTMLDKVRHELRHAYQDAAVRNPGQSNVPEAMREAWRSNLPTTGHYRRIGEERADGNGYYTRQDYMNQPSEMDAFAFGEMRGWENYQ